MTHEGPIHLLLVEDNPSDLERLSSAFDHAPHFDFELTHVSSLSEAMGRLRKHPVDLVMLDLSLPDSRGVETFIHLHTELPHIPVLVLTATEAEAKDGETAVERGAQDYLSKAEAQPLWVLRAVRYAIERARLQAQLRDAEERASSNREIDGVERLSKPPGTSVTAQLYSAGPLRESAPQAYSRAVDEYADVLELALEHRTHKETNGCSRDIQVLADQLGFLRAGPRDLVEIHTTALRSLTKSAPTKRATALVEEGRLTLLELMGNLAGYYRSFAHGDPRASEAET